MNWFYNPKREARKKLYEMDLNELKTKKLRTRILGVINVIFFGFFLFIAIIMFYVNLADSVFSFFMAVCFLVLCMGVNSDLNTIELLMY